MYIYIYTNACTYIHIYRAPPGSSSVVSTRSVSSPPKIFLKRSSLTQWMQWTDLSGWLRIVQIGYDFSATAGSHSKHLVWPLRMARTLEGVGFRVTFKLVSYPYVHPYKHMYAYAYLCIYIYMYI